MAIQDRSNGRTFEDRLGREYRIVIDAAAAERIETITGVDLARMEWSRAWKKLSGDMPLLFTAIFAAVRPQAEANGLDAQGLFDLLSKPAALAEAAAGAFMDAVIDKHDPTVRRDARATLAKLKV